MIYLLQNNLTSKMLKKIRTITAYIIMYNELRWRAKDKNDEERTKAKIYPPLDTNGILAIANVLF